jgi:hypothetical protein
VDESDPVKIIKDAGVRVDGIRSGFCTTPGRCSVKKKVKLNFPPFWKPPGSRFSTKYCGYQDPM